MSSIDIRALGQVEDATFADILVYGESKAGKTRWAGTAPKPILLIACDPTGHKAIPFPVDGVVPKTTKEIHGVLDALAAGGHEYTTLILDGMTFLTQMLVFETGKYWTSAFNAPDPDLLPIPGRQKILNEWKRIIDKLINLTQLPRVEDRVHVICTTLQERVGGHDEDSGPFGIRPYIGSANMNSNFPASFSVIGYIWCEGESTDDGGVDTTRYMQFAKTNRLLAGDRLGIFPQMGEAPNLSDYLGPKGVILK